MADHPLLVRDLASQVPGAPDGLTKSPADLQQYKRNIEGAQFLTGRGDEHPAVARMYEKADNARMNAMAAKKDPRLYHALKAGQDQKAAAQKSDTHASIEAGVQAQKRAEPQKSGTKHPKDHQLKDGWWIKNGKGKTFWHRAHK